jgi:hypothetical protein
LFNTISGVLFGLFTAIGYEQIGGNLGQAKITLVLNQIMVSRYFAPIDTSYREHGGIRFKKQSVVWLAQRLLSQGHERRSPRLLSTRETSIMSFRTPFRTVAVSVLSLVAGLLISAPASADLCASTTSCSLNLTLGNSSSGFGSGNFGTVGLSLSGNTVTITVDLANGWRVVNTGFPGSFGFSDSLGGGLTIGGFSSADYSGGSSHATSDQHFDGFGSFNDAAATTGPSAGNLAALNVVSFTVSRAGLNDVEQLLNLANPLGGDGAAYFVVDVFNSNTSGPGAGQTGLVAVTGGGGHDVPEPATVALLGLGFFGLAFMRRHMRA